MNRLSFLSATTKIFCVLTFLAVCSCEEDADIGDVGSYFDDNAYSSGERATSSSLSISPATQTIENDGDMQTFKADGGTSPYTWSLENTSSGSIVSIDENSAVYQRNVYGDNAIIVQDSDGAKAFAVISQPYSTENDLTISPTSATLTNNGYYATFTADGGTSPYTWSVKDISKGSIVSSGGKNATYQRSSAGDNVVILEDGVNDKAYAVINQP